MNKPSSEAKPLESFALVAPAHLAELEAGLKRGVILAEAQNFARDLGNQPANLAGTLDIDVTTGTAAISAIQAMAPGSPRRRSACCSRW